MAIYTYRRLQAKDSARIKCTGNYGDCQQNAMVCEQVDWNTGNTTGVSFFYLCDKCVCGRYETKAQTKEEEWR